MALLDPQVPETVARSAVLSSCGRYRYSLHRVWNDAHSRMVWIMLNPSTADYRVDDPTIRRCMSFAKRERYGGIEVYNLFAWRATDPAALERAFDPEGADNERHLQRAIDEATSNERMIVCAWGTHKAGIQAGDVLVARYALTGVEFHCLGKTKKGQPRHPLYVPSGQPFERYP